MVGTTVLACAMMSMGLIEDVNWLPTAYGFLGIGAGVCFTGYFALATDLIPKERRTEGNCHWGIRVTTIGPEPHLGLRRREPRANKLCLSGTGTLCFRFAFDLCEGV